MAKSKHSLKSVEGGGSQPEDTPRASSNKSTDQEFQSDVSADGEQLKSRLEIEKLQYDLGKGRWLEWAKAVGPWFTGLGIAVTLWLGISQIRQAQQSRDDERFERAVGRLGSEQASERLTGLAGLQQFVQGTSAERQKNALLFLVNAISIEKDDTVRDALIDALARLDKNSIQREALNSGLAAARDRNRAIYKRLFDAFWKTMKPGEPWPSSPDFTEAPIGGLEVPGRASLEATAKAIAALIRAGAYEKDMSQVYCRECEFSSKENPARLQGVIFDGSFLGRAKFERANLVGASFRNAALVGTFFNSANLEGAFLTADVPTTPWSLISAMSAGTTLALHGADFSCANLNSADFNGRAIFVVLYKNPILGVQGDSFLKANLANAKLDNSQIVVGFPREFVEQNGGKERFQLEKHFPITWNQTSGPGDPIPTIKGSSDYYAWVVSSGPSFEFKEPFDTHDYWDFILAMRNLNGAQNLDRAVMSTGLRTFLRNNHELISPSLGEPRC